MYILLIMDEILERDRIIHLAQTCACTNLRRTSRAITNYYDSLFLAVCGLRATQLTTLVVLYLAGPQVISALAEKLALDRTTLTRNLKVLEEDKHITLSPGSDQRTRVVTITKHGSTVLLKALPMWEEAQTHITLGIGENRFSTLLNSLSDVTQLARKA